MEPIKKNNTDTGNQAEPSQNLDEPNSEVKAFIQEEVESRFQRLIKETIIPEIRKAIFEALGINIPKNELPTESSPQNLQESRAHQEELPLVLEEEILPLDEKLTEVLKGRADEDKKTTLSIRDIRLGIDFGTSTTAISLRVGDEQPQVLSIGRNGESFMPSVAYFRPGPAELLDRVMVGEEAETINDETRVIRSIKRCLGCEGSNCSLQPGDKLPWCVGNGRVQISATETALPSQIAFFIIRESLIRALNLIREVNKIDFDISNIGLAPINLGCGVNFNLAQRNIIFETAKALGFENLSVKNVVEEPIFAGFAFSRFSETPEGRSVIYDFGGGTLDIAVLDVSRRDGKPFISVLSTAGENLLGGDDIDKVVYDEFIHQIEQNLEVGRGGVEKYLEKIDHIKIRQKAKLAKERLSGLNQFEDFLLLEQLGTVSLSITRERFETILNDSQLINKSMDAMLRALKLAYALDIAKTSNLLDVKSIVNLRLIEAAGKVDRVVLVGGVTKIPLVQERLREVFGLEKVVEEKVFDPISAVSIGAAYPKDVEHFGISSPPFGFYLEGKQQERAKYQVLLEPYTYLDFFKMIYVNSIPSYSISFNVPDKYHSVILKGKEAGLVKSKTIKELGNLTPGNYRFQVGLDGSLFLIDKDEKRRLLGRHPFTHPLQNQISEERERRYQHEVEKGLSKTIEDDRKSLFGEN